MSRSGNQRAEMGAARGLISRKKAREVRRSEDGRLETPRGSREMWMRGVKGQIWGGSCTLRRSPGPTGLGLEPLGPLVAPEERSDGVENTTSLPSLIRSDAGPAGEREQRIYLRGTSNRRRGLDNF